ncbi:MAG: RNA polymerase sigma factor [Clostridiales bacterium]|nr:RNA polymerase sigma factor [Clostridiales bacterium]
MNEEGLKFAAEVCRQTWEPLYRYVYHKVQNREEAEDITQETYIRSLAYPKFREIGRAEYLAFFKAVAANLVKDRWRRNKKRGIQVGFDAAANLAFTEDPAEAVGERMLVEQALKTLSAEQRKVVELRIIRGYSVSETARMMGLKAGHVRVLQYRALKNLAVILSKEETSHEE